MANSVESEQMLHIAVFDLGIHFLPRPDTLSVQILKVIMVTNFCNYPGHKKQMVRLYKQELLIFSVTLTGICGVLKVAMGFGVSGYLECRTGIIPYCFTCCIFTPTKRMNA